MSSRIHSKAPGRFLQFAWSEVLGSQLLFPGAEGFILTDSNRKDGLLSFCFRNVACMTAVHSIP